MLSNNLIMFVSLMLGIFIYVIFVIMGYSQIAIIPTLITTVCSLIYLKNIKKRSLDTEKRILSKLNLNQVYYSGIAGFMLEGKERVGAIVITNSKFIFEDNSKKITIDIELSEVKAVNNNGFLSLSDSNGTEIFFKVMEAEKIVRLINGRIDILKC